MPQLREHGHGECVRGDEVGGQDVGKLVGSQVGQGSEPPGAECAGAVHEYVEPAEPLDRIDQPGTVRRIGDVAGEYDHIGPCTGLVRHRHQVTLGARGDHHSANPYAQEQSQALDRVLGLRR